MVTLVLLGASFWLMLRAYLKHVLNDGGPGAPRWNKQNLLRLWVGVLVTSGVMGLANEAFPTAVISGAFLAVVFVELRRQ